MSPDEMNRKVAIGMSRGADDPEPVRDRTDQIIGNALWDVPVPVQLRSRVLAQLSQEAPPPLQTGMDHPCTAEDRDAIAVMAAASHLTNPPSTPSQHRHGPRWGVLAASMALAAAILLAILLGPANRPSAWPLDVLVAEAMVLDFAETSPRGTARSEDAALEKLFDPARFAVAPTSVRVLGTQAQAYRLVEGPLSCVLVVLPRSALAPDQEVRGLFHDSTLGPAGTVARVFPLDESRFVIAVANAEATIDHFRVKRSSFLALWIRGPVERGPTAG